MMIINNRWRIILSATAFNLLFEYSLRGVNNLLRQPILLLFLLLIYMSYFTLLEDLLVRYKLRDYHILLIGFIYGDLMNILLPGAAFTPPLYFGINWVNLLYVNIVWWGIIQGVLTFYIATRLTPRDWGHARLSRKGWMFSLLIIVSLSLILRMYARNLPQISPRSLVILLILPIVLIYIVGKTLGKDHPSVTQPSRFMDIIAISTTIVFFLSFIILTYEPAWISIHYVNLPAVKAVGAWTLSVGILIMIYRFIFRRSISV